MIDIIKQCLDFENNLKISFYLVYKLLQTRKDSSHIIRLSELYQYSPQAILYCYY